ncbi:uncharacterized protein LOC141592793 [Silene latifolia]|uniref:uncharacterized protein LOC141592793 n=1 Tax=Silene latifolia TaxID=37657 RepID=UPI003D77E21A
MMIVSQNTSFYLICPSKFKYPLAFSPSYSIPHPFHTSKSSSSPFSWRFHCLQATHGLRVPPLCSTVTTEIVETSEEELEFVEVGYISDVHGLQGEVRVKHNTDFPELRLSKPGKRWLRQQFYGKDKVLEVELVAGRGRPGDKSWIVKLDGFNDVDEARQLVGSTFLANKSDRPDLDEGEFYSRDLVGVRVIHKDTGEAVGTVVNVFNNGGNDLLQVKLELESSSEDKMSEISESAPLVWIPFVEAIVPVVDLEKREMQISPPKGLLELNIRTNEKSKKERRLLGWRERKKFQRRLISAKKKLCDLEQQHILHGLKYGERTHRNILAEQIVSVNSNLLLQAIKTLETPINGCSIRESNQDFLTWKTGKSVKISENNLASVSEDEPAGYLKHRESGLQLMSEGKLATVLVLSHRNRENYHEVDCVDLEDRDSSTISLLESLLVDMNKSIEAEKRKSMPIILISREENIQHLETLFASHDYFNYNSEKVRFLAEEKLPVVNNTVVDDKKNKVLMKSPWEILQTPIGSGGIMTGLLSNDILDDLLGAGVEYIEVCTLNERRLCGNPLFIGFVHSVETDIGIMTFEDKLEFEENFHIVLPLKSLKKLATHIEKVPWRVELKSNSHVELVDKKWVDVVPPTPNSYEFRLSLGSLLNPSVLPNACLVEVTD